MHRPELFSIHSLRSPEDIRIPTGIAQIPENCIKELNLNDQFFQQIDPSVAATFTDETMLKLLTASVPIGSEDTQVFTNIVAGRVHPGDFNPVWYGSELQFLATGFSTKGGFLSGALYDNFNLYKGRYNPSRYSLGFHETESIKADQLFSNILLSRQMRVNGNVGYAVLDSEEYITWLMNKWQGTNKAEFIEQTAAELMNEQYELGITIRAHGTMGRTHGSGYTPEESRGTRHINALEGLWVIREELIQQSEYAYRILERARVHTSEFDRIAQDVLSYTPISPDEMRGLIRVYGAIVSDTHDKLYDYQADPHESNKIRLYFGAQQDTDTSLKVYDFDDSTTTNDEYATTAAHVSAGYLTSASDSICRVLVDALQTQRRDVELLRELYSSISVMEYISSNVE